MAALRRVSLFNLAAPGTTASFFTPISISPGAVRARVTVMLNASGTLSLQATDSPPTATFNWPLNGGSALTAGAVYTFEFGVDPALSYGLQLGTDGIVGQCLWDDLIERA